MKKYLEIFADIFFLILVWLLFVLLAGWLAFTNLYFPQFELPVSIASVSVLLFAIAYTIFWVKRFKKTRVK